MTPPKETPRRLPRCLAVTQGNDKRASAYRRVVREFEDAFRTNMPGTASGHFTEIALTLLPEASALILAAAKQDRRVFDLPSPPEILQRLSENDETLQEQIQDLLQTPMACELAQQAQWILNGRRVYDLSPTLFADFVETDFSRLRGEDIPVPLKAFYIHIHLPDAERLFEVNKRAGCLLDGIYVRQTWWHQKKEPFLEVLVIFVTPENGLECIALLIPLQGNVKEHIETQATLEGNVSDWKFADQFIRLIIGLCFYLSCDDADVERQHFGPSPDLKARAKKLGGAAGKTLLQMGTIPVHYLRIGHRFETRSVELESLAAADKETRKLLKRHVVRGHFRQQPCGPGRQERKTVFVRSFWKGPPWGEAVGAIHKIRESPSHQPTKRQPNANQTGEP